MSLKDAFERTRKRVEEITSDIRGTMEEGRKTVKASRPEPVRRFLEERPTLILEEPLIKKLKKRK